MADGAGTTTAALERVLPPHDLEAEQCVLGGILLDHRALPDVEPIVSSGDFYHPGHAVIFECMQAIAARGDAIDVGTVDAELRARKHRNATGGAQYLSELTDVAVTAARVEQHARHVASLAQLRRVIGIAQELTARGMDTPRDLSAFFSDAATRILAATEPRDMGELVWFGDAVGEAFEEIEQCLQRGSSRSGLETGLVELDDLTGGWHPGELALVAARPSTGKSALLWQCADHASVVSSRPVLFFSLEMPRKDLAKRALITASGIDGKKLRAGGITQDDMNAIVGAAEAIHARRVLIDHDARSSPATIRARARRAKREHGIVALFIDYLQLVRPDRERDSREREVSEISKALKAIARDLELPVVVACQLNRKLEDRGRDARPRLADLRESGSLEQDADQVVFLYRDELLNRNTADKGIAEAIVAKQRNGPTDTIRLRWQKERTRFQSIPVDDAQHDPPEQGTSPPRRRRGPPRDQFGLPHVPNNPEAPDAE